MPKPILDYKGPVAYDSDFDMFWLASGDERWLDDALKHGLKIAGESPGWRGRLHILVELVEEGKE